MIPCIEQDALATMSTFKGIAQRVVAISSMDVYRAYGENPLYNFDTRGVIIGTVVQVSCLLVIIAISLLKPWGRRSVKEQNSASSATASSA